MNGWTLESELCKLAGTPSLREALFDLSMIQSVDDDFSVEEGSEWIRGGSETYIYRFSVIYHNLKREYVIKACVAFSYSQSIEEILASWIDRRTLIAEHSVETPKLFGSGRGIIIEEFIPFSVKDILKQGDPVLVALLPNIAFWAGICTGLGFEPIDPFSDLRSRGNDVVVIDFGEDLGPPRMIRPGGGYAEMLNRLLNWVVSCGVDCTPEIRGSMLAAFEAAYHGCLRPNGTTTPH